MLFLKSVFRVVVLSIILTFLLVYLGVKYHWGDYFNNSQTANSELQIPKLPEPADIGLDNAVIESQQKFTPEIVKEKQSSSLIGSMKKEQIAEQCSNLLSRTSKDSLSIDLAIANCVVSNYQETYQNAIDTKESISLNNKKALFLKKCRNEINPLATYSILEKQLLVGICVSNQIAQ